MNKSLKTERDDTARRLQDLTAELSTIHSSKEEIAIALKRSEDAMRRKEKECKLVRLMVQDLRLRFRTSIMVWVIWVDSGVLRRAQNGGNCQKTHYYLSKTTLGLLFCTQKHFHIG